MKIQSLATTQMTDKYVGLRPCTDMLTERATMRAKWIENKH